MSDLVGELSAGNIAQASLMQAAAAGRFAMMASDCADDRITHRELRAAGEPLLFVSVANDGPGRLRTAHTLQRWARCIVLHCCAEHAEDYEEIARSVSHYRRLWLIESTGTLAQRWATYLRKTSPRIPLIIGMEGFRA